MKRRALWVLLLFAAGDAAAAPARKPAPSSYDVRAFGAVPDGKTKATEAVRKAIAAAVAVGGGTIEFAGGGTYLTGPIHLKSNITLQVDAGTVGFDPRPSFDEIKVGVGVGVRYYTSFGPLRLDVAVPLNPGPGDPAVGVYVALGHAF